MHSIHARCERNVWNLSGGRIWFEELIHNFGDVMSTRNEQEKFKCFVKPNTKLRPNDTFLYIEKRRDVYVQAYKLYVKIVTNDQNDAGVEKMNLSNGHKSQRNEQTWQTQYYSDHT